MNLVPRESLTSDIRELKANTTATADENVTKHKVLLAKQWLCMCDTDLGTFLCRPLQNNNMKWPNSKFYVKREHTTVNFLVSTWTVTAVLTESAPGLFGYIRPIEQAETIAKKLPAIRGFNGLITILHNIHLRFCLLKHVKCKVRYWHKHES